MVQVVEMQRTGAPAQIVQAARPRSAALTAGLQGRAHDVPAFIGCSGLAVLGHINHVVALSTEGSTGSQDEAHTGQAQAKSAVNNCRQLRWGGDALHRWLGARPCAGLQRKHTDTRPAHLPDFGEGEADALVVQLKAERGLVLDQEYLQDMHVRTPGRTTAMAAVGHALQLSQAIASAMTPAPCRAAWQPVVKQPSRARAPRSAGWRGCTRRWPR